MILKVIFANSVDQDQTAPLEADWSNLIRVHTVCLYAKNRFEKFARIFSRRHKQTIFSDAGFLGILRVKMGRVVVCDCGTLWTFLLPFFKVPAKL